MKTRIGSRSNAQYDFLRFPGGEPHVKLKSIGGGFTTIDARVRDFNDLGDLLVLTDALRRIGRKIILRLPYFPGARQDRALPGEALTVKVYADIINAQRYERVEILDPHSPVVVALLDRVQVLSVLPLITTFARMHGITHLISPDAGANKRVEELGVLLGLPVYHARKHRDMKTGKLSGFAIEEMPENGRYLVVDDICDGGGTFLGLAEEFKKHAPGTKKKLFLWVTHGIFSKGLDALLREYVLIGTTDSFCEIPTFAQGVHVFKVEVL